MLKRRLLAALSFAALLSGAGAANDGWTGITASGLEFQKTDAIAMQSEDLYVGVDQIKVDYVFKNTTAADVTGTIAFPMPPITISTFMFAPTRFTAQQMDAENPLDFTAIVDGQPVTVKAEKRAYMPKPEPEPADPNAPYVPPPASAEYDEPGEDVTDYLTSMGIPISLDPAKVMDALDKLPEAKAKELIDKQYVYKDDGQNGPEIRWIMAWSIGNRFSWEQTFKAGAEVKIAHSYKAWPSGGLFYWYDWTKPTKDWDSDPNADEKKKYCIDEGTGKAINAALPADPEAGNTHHGNAFNISYVLTTAKTWKGPIGTFKLTLDKLKETNVLSVCMDGLEKSGPTTFTVTKTNYTPEKDLEVLVVTPDPAFPQ